MTCWRAGTGVVALAFVLSASAGVALAFNWAVATGLVLAALLAARVAHRTHWGPVLVVALIPALCGLGRGIPIPGVKLSELLLVASLVWVLVRPPLRLTSRDRVIELLFVVMAAVGLFAGVVAWTSAVRIDMAVLVRNATFPALIGFTWWVARQMPAHHRPRALAALLITSAPVALLAILQYLDAPGVRQFVITMVGPGLMPLPGSTFSRATGPFTIAHSLNGYLIFPIVLGALILLTRTRVPLRRRWVAAILALDVAAVVFSVTLTSFAWLAVALIVGAALQGRLRRALAWALGALMVAVPIGWEAIMQRWTEQSVPAAGTAEGFLPQTLQYRILIWQRDYLPLVDDALLIGVNGGQPVVHFESSESGYLTLLFRGGLPLLIATTLLLLAIALRAWDQSHRGVTQLDRLTGAALFAVMAFLPVAAMFWPYVTNAGFPQTLFALAGCFLNSPSLRPDPPH